MWSDLTRLVSASHRCIAPDLSEFGRSTVPPGFAVTLEGMAAFIEAFVDAAGINEPAHLVVRDIGRPFGLAWAVRHPEKLKSMAILNTVFQVDYQWHRYARACRTPLLGELLHLCMTRSGLARSILSNSGAVKPSRAQIGATYEGFTGPVRRMVLRLYRVLDPQVFGTWAIALQALASRVPSLVLWGDRDTYIDRQFDEHLGAHIVTHLPDCGHWPMMEMPQAMADMLLMHFRAALTDAPGIQASVV